VTPSQKVRNEARAFENESRLKRREAADLNIIADAKYDAFIRFDMLADKLEAEEKKAAEAAQADELADNPTLKGN
jgi:hypothetical protein